MVGRSTSAAGQEAFRWQAGSLAGLGDLPGGAFASAASAASADGSVAVGESATGSTEAHAFRWQGGALTDLGDGFLAAAADVSADGAIAVGVRALGSLSNPQPEAVRWIGTALSGLGDLPGGSFSSAARAVSADGAIVVGTADDGSAFPVGFRWEAGTMTALPGLAPGFGSLAALGISGDGSTIVGRDDPPSGSSRGFRMVGSQVTLLAGMREALDVSATGRIVGIGEGAAGAVVWDGGTGTRALLDVLRDEFGVRVGLDGWTLERATAISDDGLVVVGTGTNPAGDTEAWRVDLAPSCNDGIDNDDDGLTDGFDPGCSGPDDASELSAALACDDGVDNDGDGATDGDDPGCTSAADPAETEPGRVCDDGLDNDGDGQTDVADDPGCDDNLDGDERSAALVCDDGADNDGDGLPDFPLDRGCTTSRDPDERDAPGGVLAATKIDAATPLLASALSDLDLFGTAIAAAGDVDGDGNTDLAVGAPGAMGAGSGAGALWMLLLDATPDVVGVQAIDATRGDFTGALDPDDAFGQAVAAVGDLDGDGRDELAVGATGDDDGGAERGAAWTLWLGGDARVDAFAKESATQGVLGGALDDGELFGHAIAAIGDLDGNGVDELAVGSPFDGDGGFLSGAVFVLFRDANGHAVAYQKWSGALPVFAGGIDIFDGFGLAVARVGDLDGDGLDEVAVGAPGDDDGGPDRGAIWLVFPAADGSIRALQKISATSGGFTGPLADGDALGTALASPGDLDGDAFVDLLAGAPGDDAGGSDAGAVWQLLLTAGGQVGEHTKLSAFEGGLPVVPQPGDRFGSAIAATPGAGSADGASFDVAVGAPFDDTGGAHRGAAYVFRLDRAVCGNARIEYAEACDDGDGLDANGCSNACTVRDSIAFAGVGHGGTVTLEIDGVSVQVATFAGQSRVALTAALAAAIEADPTLAARGVGAVALDDLLVVDALIGAVTIADTGFATPVPAFGHGAAFALALALGAAGALAAAGLRRGAPA